MTLSPEEIKIGALHAMRHYVTLSYYGKTPAIMAARGIAEISVCSTFVMQVRNTWFLATAGHVLDEIRKDHERGIELSDFRLWDGWAIGSPSLQ